MRAMLFGLMLAALIPGLGHAETMALPDFKQTTLQLYMTPQEAADRMMASPADTLFLDVRTPGEVAFVGMSTLVDANVPYVIEPDFPGWDEKRSTFKLDLNPDFVADVRARLEAKGLDDKAQIILICRSGDRSSKAANVLAEAGFTNVWSVPEGFEGDLAKEGPLAGSRSVNGWKNAGLPWSYKLEKAKMYGLQD